MENKPKEKKTRKSMVRKTIEQRENEAYEKLANIQATRKVREIKEALKQGYEYAKILNDIKAIVRSDVIADLHEQDHNVIANLHEQDQEQEETE